MGNRTLGIFAALAAVEIISFQMGNAWFWPFNAAMFLTVLITIGSALRRMEQNGLAEGSGRRPMPVDEFVPAKEQERAASPSEPQREKSTHADDPPITRMSDIFPYSRHDRSHPFD
jgi:hypothetical protein